MDLFFEKYCNSIRNTKMYKNIKEFGGRTQNNKRRRIATSKKRSGFWSNPESVNHIPRSLARHPIIYSAWEKPRQGSSTIRRSNFPGCASSISFEIHFRGKLEARAPQLHFPTPVPLALSRTRSANSKLDDSSRRIMAPNYRRIDPTN